jgi:1,5-anhydro-D-fructose reductase (1,5-anhydro-D-mannitol-forming)
VLAPTVGDAAEILAAADEHGVKIVVSLPRLSAGYTRAIAEMIESGRLGTVSYARVRLSHDGALPRDGGPGWLPERFFDPATAIGGALTDLGCHPVYLVQRFLGLRPETVSGTYRSVTHRPVEDHAVVTVGYAGQAMGVIEAGFVSTEPFVIEVHGTDGRLRYSDDAGLTGSGAAFGEGPQRLPVPAEDPGPFDQWVQHIRSGTRADDNLTRAVELTRLVAAANESAATGRTIGTTARDRRGQGRADRWGRHRDRAHPRVPDVR